MIFIDMTVSISSNNVAFTLPTLAWMFNLHVTVHEHV